MEDQKTQEVLPTARSDSEEGARAQDLVAAIRARLEPIGGVELDDPSAVRCENPLRSVTKRTSSLPGNPAPPVGEPASGGHDGLLMPTRRPSGTKRMKVHVRAGG